MKKRKGFGKIILGDNEQFQFCWGYDSTRNIILILYDCNDKKIEIKYDIWTKIPHSKEYSDRVHNPYQSYMWNGKKYGASPCFGGWGKAEAREMYKKWKSLQDI